MTESALSIEWYISKIRESLKERVGGEEFYGSLTFELNIKQGSISNMNTVLKQSVVKQ